MAEEIIKQLLENPGLVLTGGAVAYGALTYATGKSRSFATEREAEAAIEGHGYDSMRDVLKGLYDKGVEHAARDEIDLRTVEAGDYLEEPETEVESDWEEIHAADPIYSD